MQWLLLAYMLPEFLFVLPMFAIYQSIGIYDTYIGMALIYQVHVLPFSIWMLRSFLEEIPKEIDDAAYLDGCNPFQAIYKIYLPLIIPGIVATAIKIYSDDINNYKYDAYKWLKRNNYR